MAVDVAGDVFTNWINCKLRDLKTDESVFAAYMIAILEGDETLDEKKEALQEILSQIIETGIDGIIDEITEKWQSTRPKNEELKADYEDVDKRLAKLLENKCITTTVQKQYTADELRIREQILAQYSQVELEECEDDDETVGGASAGTGAGGVSGGGGGGGAGTSSNANSGNAEKKTDPLLIKNTNAQDVAQLAKERREQAKLDSEAKKKKDKEDREKQKQLREEKKEKRKTVKGERRR